MLESGPAVQEGIQLLLDPNLHPVLHAGYRILGVLLAGSERCACSGVIRYELSLSINTALLCVANDIARIVRRRAIRTSADM